MPPPHIKNYSGILRNMRILVAGKEYCGNSAKLSEVGYSPMSQ